MELKLKNSVSVSLVPDQVQLPATMQVAEVVKSSHSNRSPGRCHLSKEVELSKFVWATSGCGAASWGVDFPNAYSPIRKRSLVDTGSLIIFTRSSDRCWRDGAL